MVRKSFFRERTAAEIKKLGKSLEASTVEEAARIIIRVIEKERMDLTIKLTNPILNMKPNQFSKYGPFIRLREFDSVEEAMEAELKPWQLTRDAIESVNYPAIGISIQPPKQFRGQILSEDLRPLKIAYSDLLDGAQVLAYSHQQKVPIIIEGAYGTNPRFEGWTVVGTIPSRDETTDRIKVSIRHVNAVRMTKNVPEEIRGAQFYLPLTIRPTEETEKRRYKMLQFGNYGFKVEEPLTWMWSDTALYYQYMFEDMLNTEKYRLKHPKAERFCSPSLEFTPIPQVTQLAVDIYKIIRNNLLLHDGTKPREAHANLIFGAVVNSLKYSPLFFVPKRVKGARMREHDWSIPE